jgi:hypothetical protein
MRKLLLAAGTAAALLLGLIPAQAATFNDGVYRSSDRAFLQPVFFIYGRRHYCWYYDGWHGPGFYWCGYAWHRGFGWGGGYGWHGWHFRGYRRNFHGGGHWHGGGNWHGGHWSGGGHDGFHDHNHGDSHDHGHGDAHDHGGGSHDSNNGHHHP